MFCASQESRNCGSSLWLRCVGAWRRNIFGAYKLNLFALRWDPTGQQLVGLANIREEVTIGHGQQNYSGSFTLDQSDTNGNVLVHLAGNVSAERITAD